MARVRMLQQISGTRRGWHWPQPGGEIDVGEDEAAMLTRQNMARRVEEPQPAPEADDGPPDRSERKAAWVEHAVAQGVDRAEAEATTKAKLIERFG